MGTGGTINFPQLDYWSYKSPFTTKQTSKSESETEQEKEKEGDWTKTLNSSDAESLPFDKRYSTDVGEMAPFTVRLKHWVAVIRGQEVAGCTLQDGIRNVQLLEAIVKSARSGLAVDIPI